MQRRNQKIVEETPSVFVTPELRKDMGEKAVSYTHLIAFLASNDARYITGQTIVVDGGLTVHNPTVALS